MLLCLCYYVLIDYASQIYNNGAPICFAFHAVGQYQPNFDRPRNNLLIFQLLHFYKMPLIQKKLILLPTFEQLARNYVQTGGSEYSHPLLS